MMDACHCLRSPVMEELPCICQMRHLHCQGREAVFVGFAYLLRLGLWREPGLLQGFYDRWDAFGTFVVACQVMPWRGCHREGQWG